VKKRHRLSDAAFDRIVQSAVASLPGEVREALGNLALIVQEEPNPAILEDVGFDPEEELLGLYVGVPLPDRTYGEDPYLPDTIFLFRGPLRRMCRSNQDMKEELRATLIHEVAHYLGFDEDAIRERGWD